MELIRGGVIYDTDLATKCHSWTEIDKFSEAVGTETLYNLGGVLLLVRWDAGGDLENWWKLPGEDQYSYSARDWLDSHLAPRVAYERADIELMQAPTNCD